MGHVILRAMGARLWSDSHQDVGWERRKKSMFLDKVGRKFYYTTIYPRKKRGRRKIIYANTRDFLIIESEGKEVYGMNGCFGRKCWDGIS